MISFSTLTGRENGEEEEKTASEMPDKVEGEMTSGMGGGREE